MTMHNRRGFIRTSALIGTMGALPKTAFSAPPMIGETARQSVGMSLHLTNLAGLESGRVRVASIEEMPGHGLQQFALHMMGETGSELPEGVYRATNRQGLPEFDMHIMPSGSGEYTAYFALLNV